MLATQTGDDVQALLDAAVDGVVLIDHTGKIEAFNRSAEQLFGYAANEVLGRNVKLLMTAEDAATHDAHMARYLSTRVPHIIGKGREVTARRKDGSVFPAFLSVGAVAKAEPPRFVGFVHDMSPRRQADQDAHQLQSRLWHVSRLATVGEMASGIAHELNQPLAAIANYAQACDRLLALPDADIDEVRGALKEIAAQAVRAGDIIRRLRSLARYQEDLREPGDINALTTELSELVQADAKANGVQCQLDLGKDLPMPQIHRAQIQQVILNLVRNAIEAMAEMPEKSRNLTVRTARGEDGNVEISVCDNGPGISPAIVARLFEPFCTSKPAGTGLGLAISRTIIREHGGTLQYRPNVPAGACFVFELPSTH